MLPGVLEVEFPLGVPEIRVGESVEVRVAQPSEQFPGVVPRGQEVGVATAFLLGQTLALPHYLGAQTSDTVTPRRADGQTLHNRNCYFWKKKKMLNLCSLSRFACREFSSSPHLINRLTIPAVKTCPHIEVNGFLNFDEYWTFLQ